MDLKTAYQIMDLPDTCTQKELQARYLHLTERRTYGKHLDDIQVAYNVIKEQLEKLNPPPQKTFKEKAFDFVYVYKIQLLIGLFALIVVASLSYTLINGISGQRFEANHPDDIHIAFFGDFDEEDLDPLQNKLEAMFPEWDKIKVEIVYAPGAPGTDMDMVLSQKSQAYLATTKPDVFILDHHYFELFNDDTVYAPLDQFEDGPGRFVNDDGKVIGFDLTTNDIFTGMDLADDKKYGIIPIMPKQMDNAVEFIKALTE